MALFKSLRLFLVVLVICGGAVAQQSPPAPPQAPPSQPKQKAPDLGVEVRDVPEKSITPEQARELFGVVDQILKFDSQDTGLPIKREVKRQLTDRDQVQRFLEDRMKSDRDTKRLEQSAMVLEKFGLLPRGFDLQKFLIELLREQVAGYYDERTKTVYLLNWIEPAGQKPVLAHELTHALQDQSFPLKKWLEDPDTKDIQRLIDSDEQTTARQAVVEGQAMVTLMDFYLAPTGQSVLNSPQLVDAMRYGMSLDQGSPVFARAPLFMKEALTFPYNYGLNFERELLVKGGKSLAFTAVFRDPPNTTREIMEPQTYLRHEKLPPLAAPNFDKLLKDGYRRLDVGAIGQFDVYILMAQYGVKDALRTLPSSWRGGYYYAAQPKQGESGPLGLVFVTKWASPEAARQFSGIYSAYIPKRYKAAAMNSADTWKTEEGIVFLETRGNTLLVTESLDEITIAKVRAAVFGNGLFGPSH